MRLYAFLVDVYEPKRLAGRSWRTREQYRLTVHALQACAPRELLLSSVTEKLLSELVRCYSNAGRSNATINKHLRAIKALLNLAVKTKRLKSRPDIDFLPEFHRSPRAWSPAEVGALLSACSGETGLISGAPAGDWWKALLLTLYDTGARKTALLTCRPSDASFTDRIITIPAEVQKQRAEQRLRVSEQTIEAVRKIHHRENRFLFNWPYDRYAKATWTCLNKHLKRIIHRAELDTTHGMCHRLRKTRATLGEIVSPGSATIDLGHSSRRVTERHYLDPTMLAPSTIVDRLPRPG